MKKLLGLFLILLGIIGGLYLGIYVMFIGGIIQIVQSITPTVIALGIALGLLRVMCASLVGWLIFIICVGMGKALL